MKRYFRDHLHLSCLQDGLQGGRFVGMNEPGHAQFCPAKVTDHHRCGLLQLGTLQRVKDGCSRGMSGFPTIVGTFL